MLTKFRPEDRLVKEVDEQIRITTEALHKAEQKTDSRKLPISTRCARAWRRNCRARRLDQVAARARRDTSKSQLQEYETSLKTLERNTSGHDDLQRQMKEAEDNYHLYAKKREEARIADELDRQKITNVSIAESATVPQIPSSPNRPLNLIIGVVLAGVLSLGSVFSAEMFSDGCTRRDSWKRSPARQCWQLFRLNSRRMLMRGHRESKLPEARPVAELPS